MKPFILIAFTFVSLVQSSVASSHRHTTTLQTRQGSCSDPGPDYCVPQANCTDLSGDYYTCLCRNGWEGNGFRSCLDRDECTEDDASPCPTNSVCVNRLPTDNKYSCVCMTNFVASLTNSHGAVQCVSNMPSFSPSTSSIPSATPTQVQTVAHTKTELSLDGFCPSTEDPSMIFFQDFEDGRWEGWSPNGRSDQGSSDVLSFFLGKYNFRPENDGTIFPSKTIVVPSSTSRVLLTFDTYQLGAWDGNHLEHGTDSFGMQIMGGKDDGLVATLEFGHFNQNDPDSLMVEGSNNGVDWSIASSAIEGSAGAKRLGMRISIPSLYFSDKGDDVVMTLNWSLSGIKDEFIGFDNFLAVACIDLVPSIAPSDMPSLTPSETPTNRPPPPTSPPPPPQTEPELCFSGKTVVQVKDKGKVLMEDLKLNDWVLSSDFEYQRVISLGHKESIQNAEFLQLHPSMLELTANHMLYMANQSDPISAHTVRVGDKLASGTVVTHIATVTRTGVYNPFTVSGTVVVNGELCSTHSSYQKAANLLRIDWLQSILSWQSLLQFFMAPLRIRCEYLGPCESEEYTEDGVVLWAHRYVDIIQWACVQLPVIQWLVLINLALYLLVHWCLERCFLFPITALGVGCGIAFMMKCFPEKPRKTKMA